MPPAPVCRGGAAALTAAAVVLTVLASALVGALAGGLAPARAAQPSTPPGVAVSLSQVTPAVATPGVALTVRGTIRNDTGADLAQPLVRVVLGRSALVTRADVQRWAQATGPAQGREVGRFRLRGVLPAGATAAFAVAVPRAASLGAAGYGALPLSVEAGRSSVRTFAGYQRIKQYEPIRVTWAVPLTLPPDPALFGAEGPARTEAWARALGDGSRIDRILQATANAPVTWALDPTLVPGLLPRGTGEPDTGGAAEADAGSELALRRAVEQRIVTGAAARPPWVLPDTDADVAAAADSGAASLLATSLVSRAAAAAARLGGRADIAWPADGQHREARDPALARLYAGPGLGGQVASAASLPPGSGTPDAAQRTSDGAPVLAYDEGLSRLLADTRGPQSGLLAAQRLIAETVTILDERPGTAGRSLLVAAPRSFDPDPTATTGLLATAGALPWLEPATPTDLLSAAAAAVPLEPGVAAPAPRVPAATEDDPYAGAAAVLTPSRAAGLEQTLRTVRGVALVRDDGDAFQRTWARATEQLASARWRVAPREWQTLSTRIGAAARETTDALRVSERNINFLADSGRIQVTVTNDLDVAVENVKLSLRPANPRLRVLDQPPLLRIGANSRATAVVEVSTLAAGLVPIETTLTTPDGTVIGRGVSVQVRVTPTGDWVYWTLGVLAGVVLVLGIWRSVRRRPGPQEAAGTDERVTA